VDVYAPGCPPGPETLIHAIVTLHEKIRTGEITKRRSETGAGAGIELGDTGRAARSSRVAVATPDGLSGDDTPEKQRAKA
jgi:NADH-quinone oxidoreductase subunit B